MQLNAIFLSFIKGKLKNWLNKPYYFNNNSSYKLKLAACLFVGDFIFLYFYKPFDINKLSSSLFINSLGYSLIVSLTILFTSFFIPIIFPKQFKLNKWTFGKHIIFILINLIIITIFNWLFYNKTNYNDANVITFLQMTSYTFFGAIILVSVYLFIDDKTSKLHFKKLTKDLEKNDDNTTTKNIITISSEETKEFYTIAINKLVYITNEGNYASIFINENNKLKELIIRKSLLRIEKDLIEFNNIVRCHKSYIINTNYIDSISGNTRGYQLVSKQLNLTIPVSRKYKKEDLEALILN